MIFIIKFIIYVLLPICILIASFAIFLFPNIGLPFAETNLQKTNNNIKKCINNIYRNRKELHNVNNKLSKTIKVKMLKGDDESLLMFTFREHLEKSFKEANVLIKNMSEIRQIENENKDIKILEINFSGVANINHIVSLTNIFYTQKPGVYFKKLIIRADNNKDKTLYFSAVVNGIISGESNE